MSQPTLQVCLSNSLMYLHEENLNNKLVVFIDILRNTTTMTAALFYGIEKVKPVSKVEEAAAFLGQQNIMVAGERGGLKIPEFDAGNSPLFFKGKDNSNQTLVITSTNGTQSVRLAKHAALLCCGGFINQTALVNFIKKNNLPIVLLASGGRSNVNLEDTLFAGSLVHQLKNNFDVVGDPALLAETIYLHHQQDIVGVVTNASHYVRNAVAEQKADLEYCFSDDIAPVVPIYDDGFLVLKD